MKSTTVVRAWLQAFAWRTSVYGTKYVVDQAKSAEANGGVGWASAAAKVQVAKK